MEFEDLFGPQANVVDLQAQDRWEAIEELINHLVVTRKIPAEHRDSIARCVRTRESDLTTAIGFGMAIPHGSTESLSEVVAIIGRSRKGIQFDAPDGKPVYSVILFLVPRGEFQKHAKMLMDIVESVVRKYYRDRL